MTPCSVLIYIWLNYPVGWGNYSICLVDYTLQTNVSDIFIGVCVGVRVCVCVAGSREMRKLQGTSSTLWTSRDTTQRSQPSTWTGEATVCGLRPLAFYSVYNKYSTPCVVYPLCCFCKSCNFLTPKNQQQMKRKPFNSFPQNIN